MPKEKTSEKEKKTALEDIYRQEIQKPSALAAYFGFKQFLLILLISLIGGFLAGFIQNNLFPAYQIRSNQPPLTNVALERSGRILDLDFLLQENETNYDQVFNELRKQLVGFYKAKADLSAPGAIFDSLYLESEFLGSGLIITSDGWVQTSQAVLSVDNYVAVTADKKVLKPDKKVTDRFTNTVFIHLPAVNLTPVRFGNPLELKPTDNLLVARYSLQNHGSDLIKTAIQKFAYHDQGKGADFLLTTEKEDHYFKIAKDLDKAFNGSPLFNSRNEVVGLLFNSGKPFINLAVPAYYLKSAVSNFLISGEKVVRSSLGVSYLNLSESLGLPETVAEGRLSGAVLLGDARKEILAVKPNSPAAKAGLAAGDIILKVNSEEIDEIRTLTKLIQDYTPGQEVTLTILRASKEKEVKAVLGEL